MYRYGWTFFAVSCFMVFSFSMRERRMNYKGQECACDTLEVIKTIRDKNFNRISEYDTSSFSRSEFYKLDSVDNRRLWFRDVENVDSTKFTALWNDYARNNYHASQLDFVHFYEGKKDILLAFQLGPNMDLWAYHIFVVKKVNCCFLITRSYFRHARFTYKAYSILDDRHLDSLFSILKRVNRQSVSAEEEFKYRGYFMDNVNKEKYFIDFEKEITLGATEEDTKPKGEIRDLYEYLDKQIAWRKTYVL